MSYLQSSVDKKLYCNKRYQPKLKAGQRLQYVPASTKEIDVSGGVLGLSKKTKTVNIPEKFIVHQKQARYNFSKAYQNIMMLHQMFLLRAGLIYYDRVVKSNKPV